MVDLFAEGRVVISFGGDERGVWMVRATEVTGSVHGEDGWELRRIMSWWRRVRSEES